MHLPRVRNSVRSLAGLATFKYFMSVFALVCVLTLFYRSYHVSISSDGNLRLDKREGSCVGPQLTPVKRPEPYLSFAQQLAKEVARDDLVQGASLVLYGDSITETWRGTDAGIPSQRCEGVPEVFRQHFGKYTSAILAEGGDQAAHLLWRLQHGEVFLRHDPQLIFVMIGTNDLGASRCLGGEKAILEAAPGTAERVIQDLEHLQHHNPASNIVVLAILPRGSNGPDTRAFTLPSEFSPGIAEVNKRLDTYTQSHNKLHFADCSKPFITDAQLSPDLMPDALHPNVAGMELLAQCMQPFADQYLST